MSSTTKIADRPHRRLAVCLLLYVATGTGSVALTASPGAVAPLYLAAGVAVACTLAWGLRMAWAVGLGCALVELHARWSAGQDLTPALMVPMVVTAVGAALQCGLVPLVGRRWLAEGPALERPREIIGLLLLAGPLACTVNATLSVGAMVLRTELPLRQAGLTWLDWWYGDVMGVLIGAPLMLTLIGRPTDLWRTRRLWIGVPMLLLTVLTIVLLRQQQDWERQRAAQQLDTESAALLQHARASLQQHLQAMDSLWLLQQGAGTRPDPRFATLAAHWQSALPAVGAFSIDERSTRVRADGLGREESLRVREVLARSPDAMARRARTATHLTMRGQDALDRPPLRNTWARALIDRQAAASPGMPLDTSRAIIVYRPLDAASAEARPGTADARAGAPAHAHAQPDDDGVAGAIVMVLEADTLLQALRATAPADLQTCLMDLGLERSQSVRHGLSDAVPDAAPTLAGPGDCGRAQPWRGVAHRRVDLSFAGRRWQLALWRDPMAADDATRSDPRSRLLAAGGLLLAAGLGLLQLLLTGHTRRLRAAMDDARTGRERAESAVAAHAAFLSRVSHELRTPLHAMLGLAALMRVDRRHPPDAWQARMLEQIDHSGSVLLQAVDQLLQAGDGSPATTVPPSDARRTRD